MESSNASPTRPQHRRNASSKSNMFKALVSPRRPDASPAELLPLKHHARSNTVPILPPDHPHAAKGRVLGERQGNMQSPPSSPSKSRRNVTSPSKTSVDLTTASSTPMASPKKSKSSTNLIGILGKKNRSEKDLASQPAQKDKENSTPPSSSDGPVYAPIWAQYATTNNSRSRPDTDDSQDASLDLQDEIAKYTPQDYSPSKQRNFNGSFEQPQLRPALQSRPQSMHITGSVTAGPPGRSGGNTTAGMMDRKSVDLERHRTERKTSGNSTEQSPAKEKLDVAKRGGRVMAAVAALQGKPKEPAFPAKQEQPLDPKIVDEAFEAVLELRNVPEPVRRKMRSLTLRVKADFVKQDQEASKSDRSSPTDASNHAFESTTSTKPTKSVPNASQEPDDDSRSTKRSRARSRTFTFSKREKSSDGSPSKRHRSSSKSRSIAAQQEIESTSSRPNTPRKSADQRRSGASAVPAEYIKYLKSNQDPVEVEVGRLHKLRILLRNETVAWVDAFVSMGGMTEIVNLLYRIMALEWREEHEDQLLHETLRCLKGLCTTERAMSELEKVADELFPKMMAMLFDDEKKGPAEYSTRAIIITVLFNFLTTATTSSLEALEQRARRILTYLQDPAKPEDDKPLDFVLDMRISRPYKLWSREITHVTKEVFWIFLHHLNVIPLPKPTDQASADTTPLDSSTDERAKVLAATFSQRHFPGTRAPVPAAPYIGGVEWDATTYITAHLDLLNGLLASIPTAAARNALRAELQASGFEKVLGATLRTCKEKFYAGVHDGLRAWVAAAVEDGWDTRYVREGPTQEEQARAYSPKKSPKKKDAAPPKLDLLPVMGEKKDGGDEGDDGGWLG